MGTILLIEDDADLAEVWSELLEFSGHSVIHAASLAGLRALALPSVDIAVVDWTLPDGSGEDAIGELRAQGSHARLVITTGHGADRVPDKACGADMVLRKPFRVRELRRVIGELTSESAE